MPRTLVGGHAKLGPGQGHLGLELGILHQPQSARDGAEDFAGRQTMSLRKCTPRTSRCSAYSDERARIAWDFSRHQRRQYHAHGKTQGGMTAGIGGGRLAGFDGLTGLQVADPPNRDVRDGKTPWAALVSPSSSSTAICSESLKVAGLAGDIKADNGVENIGCFVFGVPLGNGALVRRAARGNGPQLVELRLFFCRSHRRRRRQKPRSIHLRWLQQTGPGRHRRTPDRRTRISAAYFIAVVLSFRSAP